MKLQNKYDDTRLRNEQHLISLDSDEEITPAAVQDTPRTRLNGSLVGNCVANNRPFPPKKATIWTGWALPPTRYGATDDNATEYDGGDEEDVLFGCANDNQFLCGSPPQPSAPQDRASPSLRSNSFSPSQWIFGQCSSPMGKLKGTSDTREVVYVLPPKFAPDRKPNTSSMIHPPKTVMQPNKRKVVSPNAHVCGKTLNQGPAKLKNFNSVRLEAD